MLLLSGHEEESLTSERWKSFRDAVNGWRADELNGEGEMKQRGFTLIELLIAVMITGILAAIAAPIYIGYIRDAKLSEAKTVAGAIWTSLQSDSQMQCGKPVPVKGTFSRVFFGQAMGDDGDGTTRWQILGVDNTLTVLCVPTPGTNPYAASNLPLFIVSGRGSDVQGLKAGFFWDPTKDPPGALRCTIDGNDPSPITPPC